jgi:hypothetical protein
MAREIITSVPEISRKKALNIVEKGRKKITAMETGMARMPSIGTITIFAKRETTESLLK